MARKRTGIILAWDRSTFGADDIDLLDSVIDHIDMVKVGLEAMTSFDKESGNSVAECVRGWMSDQHDKDVMWDAKFHDIGNTIDKSIRNVVNQTENIRFVTVHATMSDGALNLANVACAQANVTALAVTVLTDIDDDQCFSRFFGPSSVVVQRLARCASKQGIKGFVCSSREIEILRDALGKEVVLVVPGIRPAWATANDQKRIMTPAEAAKAGANYIVVGRPILEPPPGVTPAEATKRIRKELDEALAIA